MLADVESGGVGADGIEIAAGFAGSIGLEIKGLHVTGAAPEPENDHRLRARPRRAGMRFEAQQIGETQAAESRRTGAKKRAATESSGTTRGGREHGESP